MENRTLHNCRAARQVDISAPAQLPDCRGVHQQRVRARCAPIAGALMNDLYEREARLIFGKANVIPTYRQVELLALKIDRVAQQADTGNDSDYWIAVKAAATVRAQIGGSDLPNYVNDLEEAQSNE